MQLHIAVPGGVLQPVRSGQVGLVPLAGLPAVYPRVVRPGAGVPGLTLEVLEPRPAPPAHGSWSSTSSTRADQYRSPSWSPAWRASRAFSPSDAWKIEIDLDSEIVKSKNSGPCRACRAASIRSSCLRSAVACGSAASSRAYKSAIFRPPPGRPAQRGAVGGLTLAEEQIVGLALDRLAGLEAKRPDARAHHRPGGSPRSRSPGCNNRPHPSPGHDPPASRCSPGRTPCSGSRPPPPVNARRGARRN